MFWQELDPGQVGDWVASQMDADRRIPPPSLAFAPAEQQAYFAGRWLEDHGMGGQVLSRSGTLRLWDYVDRDYDQLWQSAADYLHWMDMGREPDETVELSAEERPPPFVVRQVLTRIQGLVSLGPGGRVVIYDRGVAEISARPRASAEVTGGWRSPTEVVAAVSGMVGATRGGRLRGAFGYSEPSVYEPPTLVRPSFVFVLDGPPLEEGPRWRVSIAVAATRDDGKPTLAWTSETDDGCV
jgi:hypothetical protein